MNFIVGRHGGADPPCDRRMREYVSCEGLCAECCTGGSVCANQAGAMPRGQLRPFRKIYFEYRYADKVQRNDRQLCPPGFERAFRHLTRLQKMQTSGYNRAAGVGLPARDKSEFEGGRNNEYREN